MLEIFAILTTMKEMGFEAGHILSLVIMYVMLKKDVLKVLEKRSTEIFDKIIDTVSKRMEELILAIRDLEKSHNDRLQKIEDHIGLK